MIKTRLHIFLKDSGISIFARQWRSKGIFLVGLLLYWSVQIGGLQLPTILQRSVPAEPDDAYSYILKSSQMQSCFWQNCPALEDLARQLTAPSSDWNITWERERQYARIVNLYHPLFSILLSGGHLLGLSWETAYYTISIGGTVFIIGAIAYWLSAMTGYAASGLALTLLAFTVFKQQGLHFIVPGNLALGIAVFTWGMLLRQVEQRFWWALPVAIAVMVTMHPIGKVYAGVTLGAYVFLRYPIRSRRTWKIIAGSACLLAFSFVIPELINRLTLTFHSTLPLQGGAMQEYYTNIKEALILGQRWADSYDIHWSIMAVVILVAMFGIVPHQRRAIGVMGGITVTLLLGACLFVYPGYTAVLVRRVWIPFIIFLTGLISLATCRLMEFIRQLYRMDAQRPQPKRCFLFVHWNVVLVRNLAALLLLAMFWKFGQHVFIDYQELQAQKYRMIAGFNIAFDAQQPELLKSPGHRCKTVLYLYEIPLYLFLSHDVYDCGAVYYRALKGTPEEKTWVQENKNIRHVVTFNPLVNFPTAREGGIWLLPEERLEFHSVSMKPIDHLELYFENRGSAVTFELEVQGKGFSEQQRLQLHVPAQWSGWLSSPLPKGLLVKRFAIDVQDIRDMIFLKGIRIDPASSLYWPWDQGITLDYTFQDKRDTVYFRSGGLNPFVDRSIRVIADSGSTIIAEISE